MESYQKFFEGNRLEVKKATGGLPRSIWETYSAFANTNGGVILLGVEEIGERSLRVCGVENPEKLVKEFWDTINNPQKISLNILTERHVQIERVNDKNIIRITVPRATRFDKPVYLGENPLKGSFRRNGEGDYRCSKEDVSAMLRDASSQNLDLTVIPELPVSVLNSDSVRRYRLRMSNLRPMHTYHSLEDVEFLYQLGAVRRSEDNSLHPTQAGLLMFGNETEIVQVFPHFFLDYQEHMSTATRWTDRFISSSGDWSGNLFDFYYRAFQSLAQSLKIPFALNGIYRREETPLHTGLREALANCLIHADYNGVRGIVIVREPERIIFANPGSCRVDPEAAKTGGVSEPRNETLMKMFSLIDVGERAGSGIFNICQAWRTLGLKTPELAEELSPDRMNLSLDLAGIDDVVARLTAKKGSEKSRKGSEKTQKGSEKTQKGSEKTQKGSEKTQKGSEKSQKGSEKSQKGSEKSQKSSEKTVAKILALIRENPKISAAAMAKRLAVTSRAVEKHLANLQADKKIIRIGTARGGRWKIL